MVHAVVAAACRRGLASLPRHLHTYRPAAGAASAASAAAGLRHGRRQEHHLHHCQQQQRPGQPHRRWLSGAADKKEEEDDDMWRFEQPPMERPQAPLPGYDNPPPDHIMDLCDRLCALNAVELVMFMKLYQKRTGITEDMVRSNMGSGGGGGGGGGGAAAPAAQEEKSVFDVKLVSFDAKQKIKVIKEVRTVTGLGLKEAKELVEGAPRLLKKDMNKEDSEKLLKAFKEIGAECTMD